MTHVYPHELAAFVAERWELANIGGRGIGSDLPATAALEEVLSTCYQASLLREEERPVAFRMILCEPDEFPEDDHGPPAGFHRLRFTESRRFIPDELRRVSPAVDYHRSLIGIGLRLDGRPSMWGLVSSGPRWIQAARGGRTRWRPLPDRLVVAATDPGRLVVYRGSDRVATLHRGRIDLPAAEAFDSRWFRETFAEACEELYVLHRAATADSAHRPLDPGFVAHIGQNIIRWALSVIRSSGHGATLLFVAPKAADQHVAEPFLNIKYRFADEPPRRRIRDLILRVMEAVSRSGRDVSEAARPVGWADYVASHDELLAELDEGVYEMAHLLADLSAADGAVVLTKRLDVLGFGAEISGALPDVSEVARALDAEARQTILESAAGVGTRHRSVYRLSSALAEATGLVVSQDGDVRFVRQLNGQVTYWEQSPAG